MYRWLRVLIYASSLMISAMAMAGTQTPVPFRFDPTQSRVWFDADARLSSFRGQTQHLSGRFMLWDVSPPRISDARVSIEAGSLETGNTDRDADMRKDFLEVSRFPVIVFTLTDLLVPRPLSAGVGWDLILQGNLTVHGITREVKVPTTVRLTSEQVMARGQIRLDMRDYKIRVPRLLFVPMKREVLVGFEVVAQPEP
ncbi:MAG: YceI family protein [Nitrospinae bacterium]|nr:YceI family protein [Nitrospinota bacterium]